MLALFLLAASFTDELWMASKPVYERTLQHPFVRGLTDGSLPRESFLFYLDQDSAYLHVYGEALKSLAKKAPRAEWRKTLESHATDALATEQQLHTSILKSYGLTKATGRMAPSNYAYTNHLLATVERGKFAEGLAAMLPCYWIYQEVGRELAKKGSKNADYQRWIGQYSDPAYAKVVDQVLEMMNAAAAGLDGGRKARLKELFVISARYEYMFWDMAWRREQWAPEAARGEWISLFDGKSFTGWLNTNGGPFPSGSWVIEEGCLKTIKVANDPHFQDIITEQTFEDFELRLEWKSSAGANSGVKYMVQGFRTRRNAAGGEPGTASRGFEYQLADDERNEDALSDARHSMAALYGLVAAKGKMVKPAGEFNAVRIVKRGSHVEHWLNGVKVVDEDLEAPALKAALKVRTGNSDDARALVERPRRDCPISLQHHGDVGWFRNIVVRRL